jgi:hypothetical protein
MEDIMKKIVKIGFSFIVLILTISGAYWFIIHPKSYDYDKAVKNGDVVMGAGGLVNVDKFHSFIKNVENKQPDKLRITAFSKEGYPEIYDMDYDGNIIKCTIDNTRNLFGRDNTKSYGEYTKITKNEKNDYNLVDDTGKYKSVWIFQE